MKKEKLELKKNHHDVES